MEILVLTSGVMSLVRGLYTFSFDKWVKPSLIYWFLSRTTIVEPLSALLTLYQPLRIRITSLRDHRN